LALRVALMGFSGEPTTSSEDQFVEGHGFSRAIRREESRL
jgi:hypothetical protein